MVISGIITRFLSGQSKTAITATGVGISTLMGIADYAFGEEISLSLFFLIPIALVAWYAGRALGIAVALYSSLLWYWVNVIIATEATLSLLTYGDLASHLTIYLIVTLLVAHQRRMLDRERSASRTDYLTATLNRRAFYEIANAEIERSRRHHRPFTITYFDVDNFKYINDKLGHAVGDEVLRQITVTVSNNLRSSDNIARLGGDEFAILLPETDHNAARSVVDKIHKLVLEDMQAHNWPITLSIGVLTCDNPPLSIDAMMRSADQLMYKVKGEGKNAVVYSNCRELGMEIHAS